ncbi:bifunctional diguanylate cyclase/phosphodiesterase [Synechococcus sp. RSCCF101]|uniref:sensor domain-containing protein n=1 Tax=Synechococcus sp. RSCCF101 TaxID=2511069 RepID=UPI001244073D|nr:EAL domain-containing protein [Synechococcus sp. RSCCF101]QEY32044.1 bifunctional diguanylate cyclase/phosphodiesterase [Synechococcus sp. RSCCF101]
MRAQEPTEDEENAEAYAAAAPEQEDARGFLNDEALWDVLDTLPWGIVLYRPVADANDYVFVGLNRMVEQTEAVPRGDLLGQRLTTAFPGVEDFGLLEVLNRVKTSGRPETMPPTHYQDERISGWRENRVFRLDNGLLMAVYEDVSDRVASESLSRALLQWTQLLSESSLDGIWDWNVEDNQLYLSPRWKAQLGFADDELANSFETFTTHLHPEDRTRVLAHLQRFLDQPEELWLEEFRMQAKGGDDQWVMARGTPVLNADNKVVRLLGVHINITDRKQAEQRLIEEKRHLRFVLKATQTGSWSFDVASQAVTWSEEVEAIYGMEAGSFRGTFEEVRQAIHPDDFQAWQDDVARCLSGESDHNLQYRIVHPDGSIHWIHAHGAAVRDEQGAVIRIEGLTQDVTAHKQNERKLRQAAAVFANTCEAVILTDLDATILDVNAAFTTITGYSRAESIGRNPRFLKSGHQDQAFYQGMWNALLDRNQWSGEVWNRHKDGHPYPIRLSISRLRDENGRANGYVGVCSDISTSKQTEARLQHLSQHDSLTGLPNRACFDALLEKRLQSAQRDHSQLAVVYVDLDNFKPVNDNFGHLIGDGLLRQVADRLRDAVRSSDGVARIGGDEFVLLLDQLASTDQARIIAHQLQRSLQRPFTVSSHLVRISGSIGVSLYPQDGDDAISLMRHADAAMYRSKELGRNCISFHTREMTITAQREARLLKDLAPALAGHQLSLMYQPLVDLKTGRLRGLEVLLRWQHPSLGSIPPDLFVPLAERSGQMGSLTAHVLDQACRQGRHWLDQGLLFGRISVNMAGSEVQQGDLVERIDQTLKETGLEPRHLELEFSERALMRRSGNGSAAQLLQALKDLGVPVSLDDFGTGASSLAALRKLPLHALKLDRSFVAGLPDHDDSAAIAEAVISMGRALRLDVIAEGVELREQAAFLRDHGCPLAQGYLYGLPMPAEQIEAVLSEQT